MLLARTNPGQGVLGMVGNHLLLVAKGQDRLASRELCDAVGKTRFFKLAQFRFEFWFHHIPVVCFGISHSNHLGPFPCLHTQESECEFTRDMKMRQLFRKRCGAVDMAWVFKNT